MAHEAQATDGEVVAEKVWARLPFREGPGVGILGDSGTGKTEAMRRLIAAYVKRSTGPVLVVDDKEPLPQFEGQCLRDADALVKTPLEPGARVLVFRGDRFDRENGEVDPDTIAELQWRMAQDGVPSLVVYDELDKAANAGQWKNGDKSAVKWTFIKGRSVGASKLWGTQETQAVPAAAFNQSSHILCFRMQGAPLRLLGDRGYLEGGVADKIPKLPMPDNPKQRGYFVVLERGKDWDGATYRFK